jgi:tyrosyl-tRNA synthetase
MFGKPKIITDEAKIDELLSRGVEKVVGVEDLKKKLLSGKQLRVKLGIDPTSPNLHLGRSIPLLKLRDFQELGHKVVFIVGDFTGIIGDTSDKDAERPMLTTKQINENLKTYKQQVSKIIDIKKAEIHFNSKWLKKLNFAQIGELAQVFSINQFISRDNIARRLKEGKRVSLHETMYPLMQGFDSVAVKSDVELGGSDQWFNMLAGRDLQKKFGQPEQAVITGPIINGLDGTKMSSSKGNTINFLDKPTDMYGKVMSMQDDSIIEYLTLMTRVPLSEITQLADHMKVDPKTVKMRLAHELVAMYHGVQDGDIAEESWKSAFEKGGVPTDAKKVQVKFKVPLAELLIKQGLVSSKTEFRRLVKDGAIKFYGKVEERKIVDPETLVSESGDLKIGKKRFLKIVVTKESE